MDKSLPLSQEKLWACTMNDIDWLNRGFTSSKQELFAFGMVFIMIHTER